MWDEIWFAFVCEPVVCGLGPWSLDDSDAWKTRGPMQSVIWESDLLQKSDCSSDRLLDGTISGAKLRMNLPHT